MKSKANDKRRITLKEVMADDYIPFLEGRPKRETVIGSNDIINLKIALNTVGTLEELFQQV